MRINKEEKWWRTTLSSCAKHILTHKRNKYALKIRNAIWVENYVIVRWIDSGGIWKFSERVFCDPEFLCGLCYRVEHFFQKSATDLWNQSLFTQTQGWQPVFFCLCLFLSFFERAISSGKPALSFSASFDGWVIEYSRVRRDRYELYY